MADGQYTEAITLTAQDAGASAVMQQALAIVRELSGAVQEIGKSGQEAGQKAASGFGHVKSEAESATGGLKTFADHTRLATMGLDAMGLSAAATGARVGGLIDVLDEAKAALPELIALGVAIGTIGTGFMFLKDAADAAGKFDQSMAELGQTVRDQGGDWDRLSSSVKTWADEQERVTTFSRTELVDAVKLLTSAGTSLSDAMKIVGVAEDAAASSGHSLIDVTHGLMEAEHGRTQVLAELGIGTRAQIKDGMDLQQVLDQIEQHMGGAAAQAADTYEGKLQQLHNAFETLKEDVGEKMLPALTSIVDKIKEWVDEADSELPQVFQDFSQFGATLRDDLLPAAEDLFKALGDIAKGLTDTNSDLSDSHDGWQTLSDDLTAIVKAASDVTEGIAQAAQAIAEAAPAASDAWLGFKYILDGIVMDLAYIAGDKQTLDELKADTESIEQHFRNPGSRGDGGAGGSFGPPGYTGPDMGASVGGSWGAPKVKNNPKIGLGGGAGASSAYEPQDLKAAAQDTNALAAAHKALVDALNASRSAQHAEQLTVDQSLTSVKAKALAEERLYDAYVKAKNEIPQLVKDVQSEATQEHASQLAVQQKHQALVDATAALNKIQDSLRGKNKQSVEEKKAVQDAKHAVDEAKKSYEAADASLKTITKSLDDHTHKQKADKNAIADFIKAQDAIVASYNDRRAAADQAYADEVATAGASLQQEIDHYVQRYEIAHAANEAFFAEHHYWNAQLAADDADLYAKVRQLQSDVIKQHLNDVKNAQREEERYVSTFLDDIITQHKSFKDAFKSIWDDIVKIFIADVAKMIVESALFKNVFANLAPGFGGSASFNPLSLLSFAGGGGGISSAAVSAGGVSSFGGAPLAAGAGLVSNPADVFPQLVGSPGTTANTAVHVNIAGASPGAFGPASPLLNASGTGLSVMGALAVGVGGFSLGNAIGNFESGGGPGNTHGIWGGLGSLAGIAGVSAMFGGMGGLAGLLAAGPAGWLALGGAALLGGVVGGLFGHKDNPAQQPDKYNTQDWGQFLADFGADNAGKTDSFDQTHNQIANGQSFNISANVATATGGKGIGQYLHDQIASMTQAQITSTFGADAQQIVAMFSQWDSRGMHDGKNGNMMIGNSTFNWQQIQSMGQEAFNDLQQNPAASTSAVPSFILNRLYPDYNLATVKDANGNVIIGPASGTNGNIGSAAGSGVGAVIGNNLAKGPGEGIIRVGKPETPIHIDLSGSMIVGPSGMEEVAQTLATALHRLSDGQLPGSYTITPISRRRGGDWGPQ